MAKDIDVRKDNSQARTPSLLDSLNEMDRMFDRFLANPFGNWMPEMTQYQMPRRAMSHIKETDKGYLLTAELPGVPKEDIQINVNGNLLTVKAEQNSESQDGQSERRMYRSYNQSFTLPTTVEPEKIEAQYENGLLEIMIPKMERAQAKRIEVQSGKGSFMNRLSEQNVSENATTPQKQAKH